MVSIGGLHYTGIVPLLAILTSLYALVKCFRGLNSWREIRLASILVVAGWIIYWIPFITLDYSLHEVFWNTSPGLPLWMRLAAAWAGGGGSLFLFTLVFSLATLYLVPGSRRLLQIGLASVIILGLTAAFLNDAFTALPTQPVSGAGLNPLLKSPWLYPHPLTTFSGYALLVAAALSMVLGSASRGFILYEIGWGLLTLGILFGGYWSYETFGWGGYWAWDPVETSELMVWLTATLLPHISVIAPSLRKPVASLLASSVFLAMYVTRTGLSPLHSFAAPSIGALILFASSIAWLLVAAVQLYQSADKGWRELVSAATSSNFYRVGLLVASISLGISALFVYNTLLVPSTLATLGQQVSVPQMESGVKYFHPVLYPLLIVMLAAIPLVFMGDRLGWRGYAALLTVTGIASALLGLAVYMGTLRLAPLSPVETNIMMAAGLPWAATAASSTAMYFALIVLRRGLRGIVDSSTALSLLHLGLAVTVIGVLLSGTYAFNEQYMSDYTLKPGETISLPGGLKISFEGFNYGISSSAVDIYTNYVYHATSYYYGQAAIITLAQDFAKLVQSYEKGMQLYNNNATLRSLVDIALEKRVIPIKGFETEGRASIKYIDVARNVTVVVVVNEPIRLSVSNASIQLALVSSGNGFTLYTPIYGDIVLSTPRNLSTFLPPRLGIHEVLQIDFSKPVVVELGKLTLEVRRLTLIPEQLVRAGQGSPLVVKGDIVEGKRALLDVREGYVIVNGLKLRIPLQVPQEIIIYKIVEENPMYKRIIKAMNRSGLYRLLLDSNKLLKIAFSQDCLRRIHAGLEHLETSIDRKCLAYVDVPRKVPETAWLDVKLRLTGKGFNYETTVRIRFEAYGEVQGIHGLVPKVIHVSRGLDEVYIVIEPPVVNSMLMGESIAYHELLIYYLHEAFKRLAPEERLALAAVMAGGYQKDLLSNMKPEQAKTLLETSLIDLYLLASSFDPSNSTIARQGLLVKVKVIPGVVLVWVGPVVMALSAFYIALLRVVRGRLWRRY